MDSDCTGSCQIAFHDLQAEDLKNYERFYNLRPNKTADSVPLESFLWSGYYHARAAVAVRDGREIGLLWLYGTEDSPFAAMPLCRDEDLAYCFERVRCYFNEVLHKPLFIKLADEEAIKVLALKDEEYLVREETDFKDYLYDGEAMRSLAGKKLHKKKNHYNSFVREFAGRYEYRNLTPEDRGHIFRFLERWRETKGVEVEEHLDPEVEGIHNILKNLEILKVQMGGIFIDGTLEAFSIGSYNSAEDMAVIHIEKANPEIRGLYQAINREFLVHAFPEAALINREDDLGLPGLRKAKESYYPCGYARKYLVWQRGVFEELEEKDQVKCGSEN